MKRMATTTICGALFCAFALPAIAADTSGFIYGEVVTDRGSTYEGRLRWDNEEAFWTDFFNSVKERIPAEDDMPRDRRKKREKIKIFGIPLGVRWDDYSGSRTFKARFGDITRIQVDGGDRATLVMRDGFKLEVDGGSNDIGATIQIWDEGVGEVDVEWENIDEIRFKKAPSKLDVDAFRLYGTVKTRSGDFTGTIQWDQDEGLSTDKLDGETRDADMSIAFGRVETIERHSSRSSRVVLKDGREFILSDSNDVDDDNRGIFVDDDRYGRVLISWDAFERVDFVEPKNSGADYASFAKAGPLRGKVTSGSRIYEGEIAFDVDESRSWEIFDGNARDIEYSIQMGRIRSIVPRGYDRVDLTLKNGEKLQLSDTADTGDGNRGIVIFRDEGRSTYLEWDEVDRVDFK